MNSAKLKNSTVYALLAISIASFIVITFSIMNPARVAANHCSEGDTACETQEQADRNRCNSEFTPGTSAHAECYQRVESGGEVIPGEQEQLNQCNEFFTPGTQAHADCYIRVQNGGEVLPTDDTQDSFDPCAPDKGPLFGIPPWYKYLEGETNGQNCSVRINNLNDIWKVGLALLEALLVIAGYIAIGMVLFGGFMYSTSQGEPDKTKRALGTIRLAVIGLVLTFAAALLVSFIAGRF